MEIKYQKHNISSYRYETFYYFELKVIRHEERETQSFDIDRQLSTQPTRGVRSAQIRLASPSSESRLSRSEAGSQLTAFSQISESSTHASGVWRHSHPLVLIPIWDFYFDIAEWHILSACTWTPALMLHLTNPCAN